MRWYTATDGSAAEKVFATFKNTLTNTTTSTACPVRNQPVILQTVAASANGYHITTPVTVTGIVNNLFVGLAANYPDTTTGQTGRWTGEDIGQVQVYGYASALMYHPISTAIAAGDILVPNIVYAPGAMELPTAAVTTPAVGGLCVALAVVAQSSITRTSATAVFLRCM